MSTVIEPTVPAIVPIALPHAETWSLADVQSYVGGVPLNRIRLFPFPGTATEEDAIRIAEKENRICELVDGILVEKTMASFESQLAFALGYFLHVYLTQNPIGMILGEAGPLWLLPTKMRVPDVSFVSWDRFPERRAPKDRVYRVAPDLVAEILSDSNTKREMKKKLTEYFQAGTRLVWYIDPRDRSATIYTALDEGQKIDTDGFLDGLDVLPGFTLRLGDLFAQAEGPPQ